VGCSIKFYKLDWEVSTNSQTWGSRAGVCLSGSSQDVLTPSGTTRIRAASTPDRMKTSLPQALGTWPKCSKKIGERDWQTLHKPLIWVSKQGSKRKPVPLVWAFKQGALTGDHNVIGHSSPSKVLRESQAGGWLLTIQIEARPGVGRWSGEGQSKKGQKRGFLSRADARVFYDAAREPVRTSPVRTTQCLLACGTTG
jgi:hypothetical protein